MIIVSRTLPAKLFFTKLDIILIAAEMTVLALVFLRTIHVCRSAAGVNHALFQLYP